MKELILLLAILVIATNADSQEFYIQDCNGHIYKPYDQEDYPQNVEWYVYNYKSSKCEKCSEWGTDNPYRYGTLDLTAAFGVSVNVFSARMYDINNSNLYGGLRYIIQLGIGESGRGQY